jgi:hypothetical protein
MINDTERAEIKQALEMLNLSTSSSMIDKVLIQINAKSGDNPTATGWGCTEELDDGHAKGLIQVKGL